MRRRQYRTRRLLAILNLLEQNILVRETVSSASVCPSSNTSGCIALWSDMLELASERTSRDSVDSDEREEGLRDEAATRNSAGAVLRLRHRVALDGSVPDLDNAGCDVQTAGLWVN